MSRVIKNNDGVAVVEGTPAASLVKDVDKFFASKPPKRMAGESIAQPQKIDNFLDFYKKQSSPIFDGKGNVIGYKDGSKGTTEMFDKAIPREEYKDPVSDEPTDSKKPVEDERRFTGGSKDFNERTGRVEPDFKDSPQKKIRSSNRNEARDKAESRRKRFFQRRRSRKEAERSQREQEATQGKFITTLGT